MVPDFSVHNVEDDAATRDSKFAKVIIEPVLTPKFWEADTDQYTVNAVNIIIK